MCVCSDHPAGFYTDKLISSSTKKLELKKKINKTGLVLTFRIWILIHSQRERLDSTNEVKSVSSFMSTNTNVTVNTVAGVK